MRIKLTTTLCALITGLALPSRGFDLEGYSWTRNRTVLMHLSLPPGGPLTDGSASLNASAENALNAWNEHLIHMKFAVNRGSILPPSGEDANTSVTMSNTIYGEAFGDRTLAVTLLTPRGSTFVEADVIFNNAFSYDSYRGPLVDPDVEDFHRIALHEFGHVLGLDHPDQATPQQFKSAIMNSTISNIDSLQADDIAGAHSIYDSGPPFLSSNPAPNLVNLSTRAFVATGERVLIGGFIIQGSQPATVILRAIGNSLPAVGIQNPLRDPEMELRGSTGALLGHSDDWIDSPDASAIASYRLDPTNSRESAILATLNPGDYTFVVKAFDNGDGDLSGTSVVELYVLQSSGSRAANISTRGQVLQGDQVVIGGFIVGGSQPKTVIMRALGPSLGQSQIADPLNDPTLELRDAAGTLLAFNNNWGDGPNAAQIQAEGFAPPQAAESALRVTLNPGSYTGIVRSATGDTGIGLVEIYDLSPPPN